LTEGGGVTTSAGVMEPAFAMLVVFFGLRVRLTDGGVKGVCGEGPGLDTGRGLCRFE
jgi:hypothetical protein